MNDIGISTILIAIVFVNVAIGITVYSKLKNVIRSESKEIKDKIGRMSVAARYE